jgi:hypothetical protein
MKTRTVRLHTGPATEPVHVLQEWLRERNRQVEHNPSIKDNKKITQRTVLYTIRPRILKEVDPQFNKKKNAMKNLASQIDEICLVEFGKTREELGIIAADRAQMYFEGEVYNVSIDDIADLVSLGVDVVFVEKEGVCEVLAPYASVVGVALVNSRGFFVEAAVQLAECACFRGGNIWIVTDLDVSGLLMSLKLMPIVVKQDEKLALHSDDEKIWQLAVSCRLGVDFQMLEDLGLNKQDVQEPHKPYNKKGKPNNHYRPLLDGMVEVRTGIPASTIKNCIWMLKFKVDPEVLEYVGHHRIEIDSVIAALGDDGARRFWQYLQSRMQQLRPERDYNRAIDVPNYNNVGYWRQDDNPHLPEPFRRLATEVAKRLNYATHFEELDIKEELSGVDDGFRNVNKLFKDIQKLVLDKAMKDPKVAALMAAIEQLLETGKEPQQGYWVTKEEEQKRSQEDCTWLQEQFKKIHEESNKTRKEEQEEREEGAHE